MERSSFYRYLKEIKKQEGFKIHGGKRAFRVANPRSPGEEAEVDLGQMKMKDINGNFSKVYFFVMVLCYSRMKYVYFSPVPFDGLRFVFAHDKAFRYYGGHTRRIMYDQDRVQVVAENAGDIIYNKDFDEFHNKVGYDISMCKGHDPLRDVQRLTLARARIAIATQPAKEARGTKGMVENVVNFVKINFLANREYSGIDSLNKACLEWLDRTGNGTPNRTTYKTPRAMYDEEKNYLIAYEKQSISLVRQRVVTATNIGTILYKKNRYSLPRGRCNQGDRLLITEEENTLIITDIATNEVIATHKLGEGEGQVFVHPETKKMPQIYLKLLKDFDKCEDAKTFLDNMAKAMPRYITEQCNMLLRALKMYERQEVVKAIKVCVKKNSCTANEVMVILISKFGSLEAKKVVPERTIKTYENKAEEISKYDILLGDKNE